MLSLVNMHIRSFYFTHVSIISISCRIFLRFFNGMLKYPERLHQGTRKIAIKGMS